MCCDEIKWIEKTHSAWDTILECTREGHFLWLCINDVYNRYTGDVNVGDQLRGSYQSDAKLMQKIKWWHTYYYWGRKQDLINVYVAFK